MAPAPTALWAEAVPDTGLMTADQLVTMPADRSRYELVRGRLVRLPAADLRRQMTTADLVSMLRAFIAAKALDGAVLPETRFLVSSPDEEDTVLTPAVAVASSDRLAGARTAETAGYVRAAPDLVVEIASPGQQRPDLADKLSLWFRAGVRLAWVIWPARRQVDVWRAAPPDHTPTTLSAHDTLDGADVVPGFTCLVAHLFL